MNCLNCNNLLSKRQTRFCSHLCSINTIRALSSKQKGRGKSRTRILYNGKREYEYRVIYFNHTGYFPKENEIIHHINENPKDNRIENLELLTGDAAREHIKKHAIHKYKARIDESQAGVIKIGDKEIWF